MTKIEKTTARYVVYGFEIGEQGTPHLQGYVEFENAVSMKRVKTEIGDKAHVEKRRGTNRQARDYCRKDGNWWEKGEFTTQGQRTDLEEIADSIKEGKPLSMIAEDFPGQYIRYGRGIEKYALTVRKPPKWRDVQVMVYWGKTGTGKTRAAMEEKSVYKLNTNTNGTLWFDGYDGEETLLIDDFYGWVKYGELLTLLDGYPYRCQIKGASAWAQWTKVIITSNKQVSEWYPSISDIGALNRRILKIVKF